MFLSSPKKTCYSAHRREHGTQLIMVLSSACSSNYRRKHVTQITEESMLLSSACYSAQHIPQLTEENMLLSRLKKRNMLLKRVGTLQEQQQQYFSYISTMQDWRVQLRSLNTEEFSFYPAHQAAYVTPYGAISKMRIPCSGYRLAWKPATTRLVDVPISVQVPPSVAAQKSGNGIGCVMWFARQVIRRLCLWPPYAVWGSKSGHSASLHLLCGTGYTFNLHKQRKQSSTGYWVQSQYGNHTLWKPKKTL